MLIDYSKFVIGGTNDFNVLAKYYDFLARVVFGNAVQKSQQNFLSEVKLSNQLLILGGGTGQILLALEELNLSLKIDYIEQSSKMIEKSRHRGPFKNLKVNFIEADILNYDLADYRYDMVITNFFLDVFTKTHLIKIIEKVTNSLKVSSTWLLTDFRKTNRLGNKILLKVMYLFFRIMTNLEGRSLRNFEKHLSRVGWTKIRSKYFYSEMIESCVYKKS